MQYRKDIQILRGLSVLLVVLYHLEIGGLSSGFLGVDVFFVISGYLMALLYDPTKKVNFFVKRARRLLPAYFVVVIAVLVISIVRTTLNDYGQVAEQSLFASTFTSNIGYWMDNSYFDKAAFKPLLHLWSLGVEIQFYLLVPLLFGVFKKINGSYVLLLLGSLVACFFVVRISPKTSFFWVPFRLWEFLLGYGVATNFSKIKQAISPSLQWLGAIFLVVLIGIPFFRVDGLALNIVTGHPGIVALVICLATTGILAIGLPKRIEAFPLATLLEKLGTYSYSIYLVHYPLIVLFLYQPFSGTILKSSNIVQLVVLVIGISGLSLALYHFVETPLRANKRTLRLVLAGIASVLILYPAGVALQKLVIPEKEMLIYQAWTDRAEYRCGKLGRLFAPTALTCEITNPIEKPVHRVLLVGDSHADSIKTTFASVAQSKNISVWFMVENTPLLVGGITPTGLINEALSHKVDSIVLHYSAGAMKASIVEQVIALAKEHSMTVSYILPVPAFPEYVPLSLWKHLKQQEPLPTSTVRDYQETNRPLLDGLAQLHEPNFKVYPTTDAFCQEACRMVDDAGKPLYFDQWHLTLTGSEFLRGVFERMLADLDRPFSA